MATTSTSTSRAPTRPSSSPSEAEAGARAGAGDPAGAGAAATTLFGGIFARGAVAAATSDRAVLQAMLDSEAALARGCARRGLIPGGAAEQIVAACEADRYDIAALGAEAARHVQPVVGLVAALRAAVGGDAGAHVHHGATSQDILDTALMLVARRALAPLAADLLRAADALAQLAELHARTPMIARTLMQQALPTSFGLKLAGWFSGLDGARHGVARVSAGLALQFGGPVGARHDPELAAGMALELGLVAPVLAWPGDRRPVAELAAALGIAAGAVAKFATDVTLMAQTEVGELRETDAGGSSSMPHKRNPVAAISALACARRTPGLVATLLAAMAGEHERAAGAWQAEWQPLLELLTLTGSAARWAADLAGGLDPDVDRMAANLGPHRVVPADLDAAGALVAAALSARG